MAKSDIVFCIQCWVSLSHLPTTRRTDSKRGRQTEREWERESVQRVEHLCML